MEKHAILSIELHRRENNYGLFDFSLLRNVRKMFVFMQGNTNEMIHYTHIQLFMSIWSLLQLRRFATNRD